MVAPATSSSQRPTATPESFHSTWTQLINKLADAVMKKFAHSDPSKTFTPDQKNDIKQHLCRLLPESLPESHMPSHPTYSVMIRKAIEELNEEHGSTEEEISTFIEEKFDSLPWAHASFLNLHLNKLNKRGEIVTVSRNRYMLPPEKNVLLPRRERIPKQKRTEKCKGRKTSASRIKFKTCAQDQVEVNVKQRKQGQQHQESHDFKAVSDQTRSPDQETIQDVVSEQKYERRMEETELIAEKQNLDPTPHEGSRVVVDKNGFPNAEPGDVTMSDVQDDTVIVEQQDSAARKDKVTEVEVTEQQLLHDKPSQEPIEVQQHKVIDCQNGSPDEENVQQVQRNRLEIQRVEVTKTIENHCAVTGQLREDGQDIQYSMQDEQCSKMTENEEIGSGSTEEQQGTVGIHEKEMQECETQVEVTEQRKYGHISPEEQNDNVIYCQNDPEKQNKRQGDVDEDLMQEYIVSSEELIDTELTDKATEEFTEGTMDEAIEELYRTIEQPCQVIEQHIQGVSRHVNLQKEVVEPIEKLTAKDAHRSDMISEPNRPQDQIESSWRIFNSGMQELLSQSQEKVEATVVNSTLSKTSQKSPLHVVSILTEENCLKLMTRTGKLLENSIKVQEMILQVQKQLCERFKELREINKNSVIKERPMPFSGHCGDREFIGCGFPAKNKDQIEMSAHRTALESQLNEFSASFERPTDASHATELSRSQGKVSNLGQKQLRKCQNGLFKTIPDAEPPQQPEIGHSEILRNLSTKETEDGELLGPVRKKICLSVEENHEKEKELQGHNAEGKAHLCSQEKISVSLSVPTYQQDVSMHELETQQRQVQKPEKPRDVESMSAEGGITAHVPMTNPRESSVDYIPMQDVDPELTMEQNFSENTQEPQPFSQENQQQAILYDMVDKSVGKNDNHAGKKVSKEKVSELELMVSEPCETHLEQSDHMQLVTPGKQPSGSDCEMTEAPKCQEHQAQNVRKEKDAQSNHPTLKLTESDQSCQKQLEKQEKQHQRQLCPLGKKLPKSDHGVATAPECQDQRQSRDPIKETVKPDRKPSEHRPLRPDGQRHSESELSLTTSLVELSPRINQDSKLQNKKTRVIRQQKKSVEETGQRLLQQRQLRPRGQSEAKHCSISNTAMSQGEKKGVEDSCLPEEKHQVERDEMGDSSQREKWCTPEPPTMPNTIGAILTSHKGSDQSVDPNPETFQDSEPTAANHLSKPMMIKGYTRKKVKSKPTIESSGVLALTSKQLVMEPKIQVKPPQLNPAAPEQLPQTTKVLPQKQQLLGCTTRMQLRSCSQAASQSEPDVSVIESPSSRKHPEQTKEEKHPEQPRNQRGKRPKLDRAGSGGDESLPSKRRKLQEQPERRRARPPPKLDVYITPGRTLISKNKQKQPKIQVSGKPRKVTEAKPKSQVNGKPPKGTAGILKSPVRGTPQKVTPGTSMIKGRRRAQKVTEET